MNTPTETKSLDVPKLMENLLELQTLEFEELIQPTTEKRIATLRALVPPPVLAHYDRLCARGKRGVAILSHQTCTACHMHVPLGIVLELQHGEDIRCCDNCGRYLYLKDEPVAPPEPEPVKPVKLAKPAARTTRKHLAHAH